MKQYKITSAMFRGEDDTLPDCVLDQTDPYHPSNIAPTDMADFTFTKKGLEETTKRDQPI
jgi:hypothetical protein